MEKALEAREKNGQDAKKFWTNVREIDDSKEGGGTIRPGRTANNLRDKLRTLFKTCETAVENRRDHTIEQEVLDRGKALQLRWDAFRARMRPGKVIPIEAPPAGDGTGDGEECGE